MQQNSKTLIILIGNARGSEVAWNSLYQNVMLPLNADLALVLGDDKINRNNSLFHRAKYIKLIHEYDDWGDCIDMIAEKADLNHINWRKVHLENKQFDPALWGGVKYNGHLIKGAGAIQNCHRWFVTELIHEHKLLEKYDQFIMTRTDHYYASKQHLLDNNNIWIPKGEDWGGICDRYIVLNKSNVVKSLNIIPWIIKQKTQVLSHTNPETALLKFYISIGVFPLIKRFDRTFFTVKTKDDPTRWSGNAMFIEQLGVYSKYPNEFYDTCKTLEKNRVKEY